MTPECIRAVDDLQQESEAFCNLTIEQLLYAAISALPDGVEEVRYVLDHTDWAKWCPNVSAD